MNSGRKELRMAFQFTASEKMGTGVLHLKGLNSVPSPDEQETYSPLDSQQE